MAVLEISEAGEALPVAGKTLPVTENVATTAVCSHMATGTLCLLASHQQPNHQISEAGEALPVAGKTLPVTENVATTAVCSHMATGTLCLLASHQQPNHPRYAAPHVYLLHAICAAGRLTSDHP